MGNRVSTGKIEAWKLDYQKAISEYNQQQYNLKKIDPNFPELKIQDNQYKTDWRKLPRLITV